MRWRERLTVRSIEQAGAGARAATEVLSRRLVQRDDGAPPAGPVHRAAWLPATTALDAAGAEAAR